ncbi:hemolysin family protein [Glycomyces sp. NRRL B-16210]|uniref:hemolysin family protein n=1 Tax=Glycomyces sp. NRRL B-16210 TaxID=1463821 RepID=UPI0004C00D51|nr:hemolysin family protein [Glycomyces sp. NRRL B-16210]
MDGYGLNLALVGVLVLMNALFAGSEMALVSLREGQLRALEREPGKGARTLVRLARDPNRFLATIQIGITLAGFLASATAAVSLAAPLVPALEFLGGAADAVAVGLVTVVLTFFTLVLGELAPKRIAMQNALRWALIAAKPLNFLSTVSRPVVLALSASTNVVVRIFGGSTEPDSDQMDPAELRELVSGQRTLNPEQRQIIVGALEIHARRLREVLVPRRSVFTLPADTDVREARMLLAASGHSRAPVTGPTGLDDVLGVVNLRNLLDDASGLTEAMRQPVVFPESLRVTDALRRFKTDHEQFAVVVDEHGGIGGIVTIEDLLEEFVGEIYDETDRDVMGVTHLADGTMSVPGVFPVHDLEDLGVELTDPPEGGYTTVAGLVLAKLGRLPETPGDRARVSGWVFEVAAIEQHAITTVRIKRATGGAEG